MVQHIDRAEYLREYPHTTAFAALASAGEQQDKVTPGPVLLEEGSFAGKRALILGAGVGGLTAAYELLLHQTGMKVTIVEAQNRTGGRCLSLRTGDTLVEATDDRLNNNTPGEVQMVRFVQPVGDAAPYLNAGPGRIPSAHKRLLNYLRDFGVDVEIYVMNSMSNLIYMDEGPLAGAPQTYRQIDHNVRGWIAHMVYANAGALLESIVADDDQAKHAMLVDALQRLMVSFGELNADGSYAPTAGDEGLENSISRAGFDVLPGVAQGKIAEAIQLKTLLESEFWKQTKFYQPSDFLWQQSIFQPVGGMDQVQHAFARKVAELGGDIRLNSPVRKIAWDKKKGEYVIHVGQVGTDATTEHRADYVFSNMMMPFLEDILDDSLWRGKSKAGFSPAFKAGLSAVFAAQAIPRYDKDDKFQERFLACTTKVGWQGNRTLWQGEHLANRHYKGLSLTTTEVVKNEEGVVPIYGGISYTSHPITQIWYPSTAYHDEKGVLTGAYNYEDVAYEWGQLSPDERLKLAREGASQFGKAFGAGLDCGVAIAWQNMPYIKGGWSNWHAVDNAVTHFNDLSQGTGVADAAGKIGDPTFFVVGDQLSSLPGWQEGAIAAALNALSRMARPDLAIPHVASLPDTRLMVQGI